MTQLQLMILIAVIVGIVLLVIEFIILTRNRKKRYIYAPIKEKDSQVFRYSFSAKLNLTTEDNKELYNSVKNEFLSYNNVHTNITWNYETVKYNKLIVARINVRKDLLLVYLPIKDESHIHDGYDCSEYERFKGTHLRLRVTNNDDLNKVTKLIKLVMKHNLINKNENYNETRFYEENRGFETLLEEGLIRPFDSNEYHQQQIDYLVDNGWDFKRNK